MRRFFKIISSFFQYGVHAELLCKIFVQIENCLIQLGFKRWLNYSYTSLTTDMLLIE